MDFRVRLIRFLYSITTGTFGRGFNFAMRNVFRVVPNKKMTVQLTDDSLFRFDLRDYYWNRVVLENYQYEPELEHALRVLKDVNYVFLDCGANIGYWSVLVSSESFGAKRAVAVEASPETFLHLNENCEVNNGRFAARNNAIYHEDGHEFTMSDAAHHAAKQIETTNDANKEKVLSITIDTIVKEQKIPKKARLVIKLDVEGQEINAIRGAGEVLKRDCLLIYEDHGQDRLHSVTKYVMDELGWEVYYVADDLSTTKLDTVKELDGIKTSRGVGYNFFACRNGSGFSKKLKNLIA